MWSKPRPAVMARMPSTRAQPLNPRAVPPVGLRPAGLPSPAPTDAEIDEQERARREGGFHESSYELQHGLEVSESDWPEELTVPAALGSR
jgi:hypothetical protein